MSEEKTVALNRKARHEYFIEETMEAGLVLSGTEIKSVRAGNVSLQEAFGRVEGREIWIHGMNISPYEAGNRYNLPSKRPRKVLLHKREISRLVGKVEQRGYALIPLRVYFVQGLAKVELALGKGKKLYDKREAVKEKEAKRSLARQIRGREKE